LIVLPNTTPKTSAINTALKPMAFAKMYANKVMPVDINNPR
jgi:hypothetical protein